MNAEAESARQLELHTVAERVGAAWAGYWRDRGYLPH